MEQVGFRALQQNAAAVLRRVGAGATIEVTSRGRPVARLVPLAGGIEALVRTGSACPATRSVKDLREPLRSEAGESLGDLLAQHRADEG